jgi:hypothetical protein
VLVRVGPVQIIVERSLCDHGLEARGPCVEVEYGGGEPGRPNSIEQLSSVLPGRPAHSISHSAKRLSHDLGEIAYAVVLVVRAHVERLVPASAVGATNSAAGATARFRTCTRSGQGVPSLMIKTLPVVKAQAARLLNHIEATARRGTSSVAFRRKIGAKSSSASPDSSSSAWTSILHSSHVANIRAERRKVERLLERIPRRRKCRARRPRGRPPKRVGATTEPM